MAARKEAAVAARRAEEEAAAARMAAEAEAKKAEEQARKCAPLLLPAVLRCAGLRALLWSAACLQCLRCCLWSDPQLCARLSAPPLQGR